MSRPQLPNQNRITRVLNWLERARIRTDRSDQRRRAVFYSLLLVLVLFCAAIGVGLANNNTSVAAVIVVSFAALVVIQLAYVAALFIEAYRG